MKIINKPVSNVEPAKPKTSIWEHILVWFIIVVLTVLLTAGAIAALLSTPA